MQNRYRYHNSDRYENRQHIQQRRSPQGWVFQHTEPSRLFRRHAIVQTWLYTKNTLHDTTDRWTVTKSRTAVTSISVNIPTRPSRLRVIGCITLFQRFSSYRGHQTTDDNSVTARLLETTLLSINHLRRGH